MKKRRKRVVSNYIKLDITIILFIVTWKEKITNFQLAVESYFEQATPYFKRPPPLRPHLKVSKSHNTVFINFPIYQYLSAFIIFQRMIKIFSSSQKHTVK